MRPLATITVLPEVALRLTFFCTHAVKFKFSGGAASRYYYSLWTARRDQRKEAYF